MKSLLLDLDGTIREPKDPEKVFIDRPDNQKLIEGAKESIEYFADRGFLIFGITNQGGVQAGYKTLEDCALEQQFTINLCPFLHRIYFCPDEGETLYSVSKENWAQVAISEPETNDSPGIDYSKNYSYRKPETGTFQYIADSFSIDLKKSLFVGDRAEDKQAASKIDCSFLWAETWLKLFANK